MDILSVGCGYLSQQRVRNHRSGTTDSDFWVFIYIARTMPIVVLLIGFFAFRSCSTEES